MFTLYFGLIVGVLSSLMACGPQQASKPALSNALSGKLIITGSSTIAPLAAELAKQFEQQYAQVKVDVQTGGSSRGITDVRQGIANIGMVSRQLKATENDLTPHLLAKDGVGMIVHKTNPVQALSEEQIKAIYLGKVNNWKTYNGMDKKITVISKADGRSTLEVFTEYFKIKSSQIKPDIIIGDNEQAIKLVANNPYALAYVSIGTAEYDIGLGIPIKTLPLNGINANTNTLLSNQFPLSRELNFISIGNLSALAQAFLDFSQSPAANSMIKDYGFVPAQP